MPKWSRWRTASYWHSAPGIWRWQCDLLPWSPGQPVSRAAGELSVWPVAPVASSQPGQLDVANAGYVLATLEAATRGCLDGHFQAMVTAPVHKGVINDAGIPFSGHTEFLQRSLRGRAGGDDAGHAAGCGWRWSPRICRCGLWPMPSPRRG